MVPSSHDTSVFMGMKSANRPWILGESPHRAKSTIPPFVCISPISVPTISTFTQSRLTRADRPGLPTKGQVLVVIETACELCKLNYPHSVVHSAIFGLRASSTVLASISAFFASAFMENRRSSHGERERGRDGQRRSSGSTCNGNSSWQTFGGYSNQWSRSQGDGADVIGDELKDFRLWQGERALQAQAERESNSAWLFADVMSVHFNTLREALAPKDSAMDSARQSPVISRDGSPTPMPAPMSHSIPSSSSTSMMQSTPPTNFPSPTTSPCVAFPPIAPPVPL